MSEQVAARVRLGTAQGLSIENVLGAWHGAFVYEMFSDELRRVLDSVQDIAGSLGHADVGSEHLLLALCAVPETPVAMMLRTLGATADALRDAVIESRGLGSAPREDFKPLSPEATEVLTQAIVEAESQDASEVQAQHLLLGLLRQGAAAAELLTSFGASLEVLRALVPRGERWAEAHGPMVDSMQALMARYQQRHGLGADRQGLPTGLADLDHLSGGGQPGELWVVNGPSGVGKTVFALGLARNAAIRQEAPVQWLTTVEDPVDLLETLLCAEGRVPLHHMRRGQMTDDDWARIARTMGHVAEAPLTFLSIGCEQAIGAAQSLAASPPRMLVIDALPDPADRDALAAWKAITTRLNCWTLVVAGDKSGLDASEVDRAQSACADMIIWLYREDMEDHNSPRAGEADICVSRSRATAVTTVTVAFQGHYGRFVEMTVA